MDVNSYFIKQEINRFECVHPCIYTAYHYLDRIKNRELANKIKEHVINIEDSFVNSQEWTLSSSISEIRLAVIGSQNSGKSSLVHYFLTGVYVEDDSPEGGRFKKLIFDQSKPHLLLIRDETSVPDIRLTYWIDALIFVVSLSNLQSVQVAAQYYDIICELRKGGSVPISLVATREMPVKDNSDSEIISTIRQLVAKMNWCPYYETCILYGTAVEFIFQDIVSRVLNYRGLLKRMNCMTQNNQNEIEDWFMNPQAHRQSVVGVSTTVEVDDQLSYRSKGSYERLKQRRSRPQSTGSLLSPITNLYLNSSNWNTSTNASGGRLIPISEGYVHKKTRAGQRHKKFLVLTPDAILTCYPSKRSYLNESHGKSIDLRISTIKIPGQLYRISTTGFSSSSQNRTNNSPTLSKTESVHSAHRADSFLCGLYKTASSAKNGDVKYSSSEELHKCKAHLPETNNAISTTAASVPIVQSKKKVVHHTSPKDSAFIHSDSNADDTPQQRWSNFSTNKLSFTNSAGTTDGITLKEAVKRRYKKAKSVMIDFPSGEVKSKSDSEAHDFILINPYNVRWHFEAPSLSIRNKWVEQMELVVHNQLALDKSTKHKPQVTTTTSDGEYTQPIHEQNEQWRIGDDKPNDVELVNYSQDKCIKPREISNHSQRPLSIDLTHIGDVREDAGEAACSRQEVLKQLRSVEGNDHCADCGSFNPEWASLNLVVLVCIDCSGVHRELGVHISRIRSTTLDNWTKEHLLLMKSYGNKKANSVWEATISSQHEQYSKPTPNSTRQERTVWIQCKYVKRLFLPSLPLISKTVEEQLVDAMIRKDSRNLLLCVLMCHPGAISINDYLSKNYKSNLNNPYNSHVSRTALHIAATLGDVTGVQLLIWHGADVNVTDQYGLNAWSYAHAFKNHNCTRLLQLNGSRAIPLASTCNESLILDMEKLRSFRQSYQHNYIRAQNHYLNQTADPHSVNLSTNISNVMPFFSQSPPPASPNFGYSPNSVSDG